MLERRYGQKEKIFTTIYEMSYVFSKSKEIDHFFNSCSHSFESTSVGTEEIGKAVGVRLGEYEVEVGEEVDGMMLPLSNKIAGRESLLIPESSSEHRS